LPHASAHLLYTFHPCCDSIIAAGVRWHLHSCCTFEPLTSHNHPAVRERTALARAAASAAVAASIEPNHRHQQNSQATRSALL
jgi:hypothetical protein